MDKMILPSSWHEATLDNLAKFIMGQAPKSANCNVEGHGEVFVKAGEFGKLSPVVREWTTEPLKMADETDVLICVVGATSGKINLGIKCAIGRSVAAIRPNNYLSQKYLYRFLETQVLYLRSKSTGSAQGVISRSDLENIVIPFCTYTEQKVIAEKLDDMLAKVERIKARLERIPKILKQFRQSVLADAVSGRLTAHWRKVHLPEKIDVKAVSDSQFQLGVTHGNFGKKLDRARDILTDELSLVTQHTEGWPLIRIGSLCASVVPNRDKPKSFSGGFHWLLTPHFADQSIWIDYTKIESGLSEDEIAKFNAKVIKHGNVIMTCVGRVGLSAVLEEDAVINQQIHAFLVNEHITPKYLAYCIRANSKYYEAQSTSTTVSYLNKTSCNSLPIPLPTIEEQKEIARQIEQLFTYAANIEKQVVSSLEKVNRLSQAILSKAFRGQLTETWRKENPDLINGENSAEAMLEKIKTEMRKK